MNKLLAGLAIFLAGMITSVSGAFALNDTSTFILNVGNDLGKVQFQNGQHWFIPTPGYEYTNVEGVKEQMLKGLSYDNDFYQTRHITAGVVNGTDSYKYIDWENPVVVKSLSSIKSKLKGFLFAYRHPQTQKIFWTDGSEFTMSYFAGYGSNNNQVIILYPIKEKAGKDKGKLLGFMEYPCGNLVCRDSSCSDLIPRPVCGDGILNKDYGEQCDPKDPNTKEGCTKTCTFEEVECKVTVSTTKFDQTKDITGISVKKDSEMTINAVVVNGIAYKDESWKNIGKLPAGTYTVSAVGTNPYTKKAVKCTPATLNVANKTWCGDGAKNGDEQCDYSAPGMSAELCSKSCKLLSTSCTATINPKSFTQGDSLKETYFTVNTAGELLNNALYNEEKLTLNDLYNKNLQYCGKQTATFYTKNPYTNDGKISKCTVTFNVEKREFCGDGVIQSNEQCDPKNGKTGIACDTSCKLKTATCDITDTLTDYFVGETATFGIRTSPYSKIVAVTSGTLKGTVTSGSSVGNITFKTVGTQTITVSTQNMYDTTGATKQTCTKTVNVIAAPKCATN